MRVFDTSERRCLGSHLLEGRDAIADGGPVKDLERHGPAIRLVPSAMHEARAAGPEQILKHVVPDAIAGSRRNRGWWRRERDVVGVGVRGREAIDLGYRPGVSVTGLDGIGEMAAAYNRRLVCSGHRSRWARDFGPKGTLACRIKSGELFGQI